MNKIIDGRKVPAGYEDADKDFFIAQWIDQDTGMKEVYQVSIKVCQIWKDIYAALDKSRQNIKHRNALPSVQNLSK